jgi:hypothetical protein
MLRASILAVDSCGRFQSANFPERAMTNKTLVLVLMLACLANVICLVSYL